MHRTSNWDFFDNFIILDFISLMVTLAGVLFGKWFI